MSASMGRFVGRVLRRPPPGPIHVDIEVSTQCNMACKMCKRQTFDFGDQLMPWEEFLHVLDSLPATVEIVSFGGYGEMTLHPRFVDMVGECKRRGHIVECTTNGTTLGPTLRAGLLAASMDSIRISVDHLRPPADELDVGHAFSPRIREHIAALVKERDARQAPTRVGINTVVQQSNAADLQAIVDTAEALGADDINLIPLDLGRNHASAQHKVVDRSLYATIQGKARRIHVQTPRTRHGGIRRLYKLKGDYCPFRHEGAHVRMNGQVTPCAFGFATHGFGSIHEQPLQTIWNQPEMAAIRKRGDHPVCQDCSLFKTA